MGYYRRGSQRIKAGLLEFTHERYYGSVHRTAVSELKPVSLRSILKVGSVYAMINSLPSRAQEKLLKGGV
jgi:hypothetical protein